MHHLKKWPTYSTERKTKLITLLVLKFIVFGAIFTGLILLLRNIVSPIIVIAISHVIIFAMVLGIYLLHTHRIGHNITK